MKRSFVALSVVCAVSLSNISIAQTISKSDNAATTEKVVLKTNPEFKCSGAIYFNDQNNIITMTDNVSLTTDKFQFENAGKVIYDQSSKKMTIYNCHGFTLDGTVVLKGEPGDKYIIEYTLGDDKAYLL